MAARVGCSLAYAAPWEDGLFSLLPTYCGEKKGEHHEGK